MQAAGIVNDHAAGCCVHGEVAAEQLEAAARLAWRSRAADRATGARAAPAYSAGGAFL